MAGPEFSSLSNVPGHDHRRNGAEVDAVESQVRQVLDDAWREPGFCVPNQATYPHQWLWDSCFHAVVWQALGESERAGRELGNVLAHQDPATGFVPHMVYWHAPDLHREFWGRPQTSIITQPPMYGHAARRVYGHGAPALPDQLARQLALAFAHLLFERPRTPGGLVAVLHPWETGCDDSPRWDDHRHPDRDWRTVKGDLVAALRAAAGPDGVADKSPFMVGSVGFNALLVWNIREYLATPGAVDEMGLATAADTLATAVSSRWSPTLATWVDDATDAEPTGAGGSIESSASGAAADLGSRAVRTADALLALLVDPRPAGFDQLADRAAFGAECGPRGVHRAEPTFEPDVYWRGPAWPQLSYLLWQAALAAGRTADASRLALALVAGAVGSGWAEYWHPESGAGLGARPQTWAGLALPAAIWLAETSDRGSIR